MEAKEDDALEQQALEELLKDIKRGAERAREHGAMGWQKNPGPAPNKTFLRNMLVSTLRDDHRGYRGRGFRRRDNHVFRGGGNDRFDRGTKRRYSDDRLHNRKWSKHSGEKDRTPEYYVRPDEKRKRHRSGSEPRHEERDVENGKYRDRIDRSKHKRTENSDNEGQGGKKHKKSKKSKKHKSRKSSHKKKGKK